MYIKNYDSEFSTEVEFEGLKKDGKFWFPHGVKYLAWFLVLVCIITSSTLLIYYGMSFGMIKTYLWITAIIGLILQGIFLTAPIRIMIMSFIKGACLKLKTVIIRRPVSLSSLSNPYDPIKKKQVLNFRKFNAHLYKPRPLYKMQNRIQEVKYNMELRNLTVDVITHLFFMITVFYVVLINKTELGYLSTHVIENLVVKGSYTNSIAFTNISTYDTLLEYLNKTLLPALLINYKDYKKLSAAFDNEPFYERKRSQRELSQFDSVLRNKTREGQKLKILDHFYDWTKKESDFYQRGWTLEPAVKLIGKPRIRQVRVKGDSCEQLIDIESRNIECAAELSFLNVETKNFSLSWNPWPGKGLTPAQREPWIYKSGWETKTMPIFAKFSSYPWGGYILDLGKSINDSRIILEFLDAFEWIDMKTRGVFIEFTTYCVNSNLFNVVTLIAEKSATGYIIPSYKIDTCGFLFLSVKLEVLSVVMVILFSLLLFFFTLRESLRMHRTSIWLYIKRNFALLNLAIIFFGVLSLVFLILRSSYVENLLKELEISDNNDFVSFILAAYWHKVSVYIEAFLVCLAAFKVFRLLVFRVIFFQLQTTLSYCCKQFIDLVLQIIVLIIGFALFFYLCLNVYAHCFSNFALSLSTMLGRSVLLDDTFDFSIFNSSYWYTAPVFFAIFIVTITILFMNLFIAVICWYFSFIRKISLVNKYSILRYVKHVLTSDRKSDLLSIKGENRFERRNPKILGLKSGRSSFSKRSSPKIKAKSSSPKIKEKPITKEKKMNSEEENPFKTYLRDFVKEKLYEPMNFQSLAEERALTMKYLIISVLTDNEDERKKAREKALLAFFVIITSGRKLLRKKPSFDQFILVSRDSEKEAVNKKRLLEMKKTVEEFGKQKGWIAEEDFAKEWDSADRLIIDLNTLDQKIDSLLKKYSKIKNL